MNTDSTHDGLTADELRDRAGERHARNIDRYDRDELGLSMASDSIMARVDNRNADILDAGGVWLFKRLTLVRLDGSVTDARIVQTKYGSRWRCDEDDKWAPVSPKRESTLAKYGYREVAEYEVAPARAITWAPPGARGLSGMTSVQAIIIRTDVPARDGWHANGHPSELDSRTEGESPDPNWMNP